MSSKKPSAMAILILGMHRSGTSMVTRVCNLLGAELGGRVLPPSKDNNEAGFWENADIVALHDELLATIDRLWSSTHPLPANWWDMQEIAPFRARLSELIAKEFADASLWCIKDPRLCRLLPLWKAILKEQNIQPVYVHIVRHPAEVVASLAQRDKMREEQAALLWLQHVVEAEIETRGDKRLFVSYDAVLDDWKDVAKRMEKALSIRWPVAPADAEEAVASFLNPELQHHKAAARSEKTLPWAEEAWKALSAVLKKGEDDSFHTVFTTLSARLAAAEINLAAWWMEQLSASRALAELSIAHGQLSEQHHETNLRHAEALDALADARLRLLETTDRLNAVSREAQQRERQMQQMNERLRDITTSFTWRWASKLRFTERFAEAAMKFLLRRPVAFKVVAEKGEGGRTTLELMPDTSRFPTRWVLLDAMLKLSEGAEAHPTLAVDDSLKNREVIKVNLPVGKDGRVRKLLRLPDFVQAMRLYMQNGATLGDMRMTPLTRTEALARLFWPRLKARLRQPQQTVQTFHRLIEVAREHGIFGLKKELRSIVLRLTGVQKPAEDPQHWFEHYRLSEAQLTRMRSRSWAPDAPAFSLLLPVLHADVCAARTEETVESLRRQIYGNWELFLITGPESPETVRTLADRYATQEPRIHTVEAPGKGASAKEDAKAIARALKQAQGDYIQILEAGDFVEPQAFYRHAEALSEAPDTGLLYADEAITGDSHDDIRGIIARTQYSHDYFLCHPAMMGSPMFRRRLAEEAGGLDADIAPASITDLLLRLLERDPKVAHIPDVLYRRRRGLPPKDSAAAGEETRQTRKAIAAHLTRIGVKAEVKNGRAHGFYDVVYERPTTAKVAIVIPTKNRVELLRPCLESLARTVDPAIADIYVVDHESNEEPTRAYLAEISKEHTVIPYKGVFNFSAINNHAIRSIKKRYSHYLLLNNDIEAMEPGWLDHMLRLCSRPDVGVVGAVLYYPIRTIQHAGVVIGLYGGAEHAHKGDLPQNEEGLPNPGYNGSLLATRDYSAVTAACLLIKAEIFDHLKGMDEMLAVGFGDVDLCLRAEAMGYKVLLDAQAVLLHYESVSRGKSEGAMAVDPHPEDSRRYLTRYQELIRQGDPYFSPLLDPHSNSFALNPFARARDHVAPRIARVRLPGHKPAGEETLQAAA